MKINKDQILEFSSYGLKTLWRVFIHALPAIVTMWALSDDLKQFNGFAWFIGIIVAVLVYCLYKVFQYEVDPTTAYALSFGTFLLGMLIVMAVEPVSNFLGKHVWISYLLIALIIFLVGGAFHYFKVMDKMFVVYEEEEKYPFKGEMLNETVMPIIKEHHKIPELKNVSLSVFKSKTGVRGLKLNYVINGEQKYINLKHENNKWISDKKLDVAEFAEAMRTIANKVEVKEKDK